MTLFTFEHILIAILCFGLAIFITKHAQTKAHRLWATFNYVVVLWSIASIGVGLSTSAEQALLYWKLCLIPAIFIAVVFYHFVYAYCQIQRPIILKFVYAQGIIFAPMILFSNWFINPGILINHRIYFYKAEFAFYNLFTIWIIVSAIAFYELWQYATSIQGIHKTQTLFIFWASLMGFIGGASTTLPAYGIIIYPVWQISIGIYALIITYAIFKHALLPLNSIIKKSILYSMLATSISLIYLTGVIISQKLFNQYFGISSTLLTSIIIALIFTPLRNKIQCLIDTMFLKASPIEIAQQNEQLRKEIAQTEKLRAIATLASGIAHEIRNPLTAIIAFTDQLDKRSTDPAFIKQYKTIVGKESHRINLLIEELLAFAKPCPPQMQDTDPNEIIQHLLTMLEPNLKAKKIIIDIKLTAKTKIQADPNQLKQALLNLILNAIDAMPNGGTLTIETTTLSSSSVSTKNPIYTISISDTGIGISPHDISHIFDPFFTKKEKGIGLGLSITQGIIEKHQGKITVTSKTNQGTSFIIKI